MQRSIHEILGGGIGADIILWRRKSVTIGILVGALASWVVFELSCYTLLSLVSSVLLLLLCILFAWTKAAECLNRPPPPVPDLRLSEEMVNGTVTFLGSCLNKLLLAFRNISLGRDSWLFYKVAAGLWMVSVLGSYSDFVTVCYTSLVILLTLPAIYEKYEYRIGGCFISIYEKMQWMHDRLSSERLVKSQKLE